MVLVTQLIKKEQSPTRQGRGDRPDVARCRLHERGHRRRVALCRRASVRAFSMVAAGERPTTISEMHALSAAFASHHGGVTGVCQAGRC
jgi:hypothetical protein